MIHNNDLIYKTGSANIIMSDFPDLDVIRVDDTYYMVSTTMHFMPGCVILRSYNLLDWEFCSYVYDQLDGTFDQTLKDNKGIYGKGMWAASLRYNKGIFYVSFVCNDTHKTYLYTSSSITGPWKKSIIPGFYHDMSILFDDDGKVYVVSGNTDIRLTQMSEDLSGPKEGGINKIIIQDNPAEVGLGLEGSHIYKINGKYYIFLIHIPKGKMRTEACFVADCIEGPYVGGDVLCSDLGGWNSGVAQGGIVQSTDGTWYGILFQDHGALGRIPVLVLVNFENDFPVFGIKDKNGISVAVEHVKVLDNRPEHNYVPLYGNNFTDNNKNLMPYWQWNHIPDLNLVEINENNLKIKTNKICRNVTQAINTLTQRTFTEHCSCNVTVNASNLNEGDIAGLCALEGEYAFIAVTKKQGKLRLIGANHKIPYSPYTMNVYDDSLPEILMDIPFDEECIKLQLKFDLSYNNENVELKYFDSTKMEFVNLGQPCKLRYTLDQFVGVRFALFIYSQKEPGGQVEFSDFRIKLL